MHNNKTNSAVLVLMFTFILGACSGIPVSEPEPAQAIMFGDNRCTESGMSMNVETVPCGDIHQNYSHEKHEFMNEFMAAIVQGMVEGLIEGLIHALVYH